MPFQFNPSDGYRNTVTFPQKPANEMAFRDQMMQPLDQLAAYINGADPLPQYNKAAIARNILINGNFLVWQRGISGVIPASSGVYGPDRWKLYRGSFITGASWYRADGSSIPGNTNPHCLRIQRNAGNASQEPLFATQPITTLTSVQFRGKQLIFSCWMRKGATFSATSNQVVLLLEGGTGTDEDGTNFSGKMTLAASTVQVSDTWQQFTLTAPATPATLRGMAIRIHYFPQGTAGAADYLEIGQCQLSEGAVALPFTPRRFEDDLLDCLPYFEKSYSYADAPGSSIDWGAVTGHSSNGFGLVDAGNFKATKRTSPTMTLYSPFTGSVNNARRFGDVSDTAVSGLEKVSTNRPGRMYQGAGNLPNGMYQFHWTADAEL